jgi:RNA-directed DNA polymerase
LPVNARLAILAARVGSCFERASRTRLHQYAYTHSSLVVSSIIFHISSVVCTFLICAGKLGSERITEYLKQHWPAIREQLLSGTYEPKPVRRVEIPKPDGVGVRKLGIPTVLDRFIQQAVMQVLQKRWDPMFSDHSYGFRPGRSAHQAVAQAQRYIAEGYNWTVDFDLEQFFDRVNHDKLMGQIVKRVEDKRLLKLIRAFLNAGVMENGLVSPSVEGTPQGGPLSPFLSNLVLDELDRELERRGHRFVRYADDSAPRWRGKESFMGT